MLRRVLSLGFALAVVLTLSAQAQAQRPLRDRGDRVAPPPATPPAVEQPVPPPARPVEPAPRGEVPAARPADQANTHMGWFLKTDGDNKFVMRDRNGKQHTHTLARNATITCDGKSCKLSDLKRGEMLRVTTKANDSDVVVRIDATQAATDRAPNNGRDVTPVPPANPVRPPASTPPAPVNPRGDRR